MPSHPVTRRAFREANARRAVLYARQEAGPLTPGESSELTECEAMVDRWIEEHADEEWAWVEKLKAEAEKLRDDQPEPQPAPTLFPEE